MEKSRFSIILLAVFFLGALGQSRAATVTVINTADAGPGSLRQALADAAAGDTISFDPSLSGAIMLTSGELQITKSVVILGPGASALTVERSTASGTPDFRVFHVMFNTGPFDTIDVTIEGLTIANGNLAYEFGAGIEMDGIDTLNLNDCVVSGNTTVSGGAAIHCTGMANISHCIFSGNSSSDYAVLCYFTLNISFSTIGPNVGTGIFMDDGVVSNCTVAGNIAYSSTAGIIVNGGTGASIINSTISGNTSYDTQYYGAGVLGGAELTIIGCTVTNNSGYNGCGVWVYPGGYPLNLKNTIVAGNIATSGSAPDIYGDIASYGYNLIGDGTGATITPTTGDQIGTAAAPINAKLNPLANNGGPTQTHSLQSGSPAIDRGTSAGDDSISLADVTTDQRGYRRPHNYSSIANAPGGDGSDIGAFENGATPFIPSFRNLSTRVSVMTGDKVGIGGFILGSAEVGHRLLLRGIGPSLPDSISDRLSDPVLTIHKRNSDGSDAVIGSNDNWKIDGRTKRSQQSEVEATGLAPDNDKESVFLGTFDSPGGYSAIMGGKGNTNGVGLVEIFDIDDSAGSSRLVNISSRGVVLTGDDVMIGGVIIGQSDTPVVATAKGPSMAAQGLPSGSTLADPTVTLYDGNGNVMAQNDNWQEQDAGSVGAVTPYMSTSYPTESALSVTLNAGGYSAVVRGTNEDTGIALVEFYLNGK